MRTEDLTTRDPR